MEVSSVLLCSGCTSWQGLLLTASLLTCWHLPTAVQVRIESVPSQVIEGENVLLLVHNLPENFLALLWSKDVESINRGIGTYVLNKYLSVPGPFHSGRETVYSNGSLLLRNVTKKDTGFYTLQILNRHSAVVSTTTMYLHVHKPVTQPFVQISDTTVTGGTSVIFTCVSPDTDVSIRWIFNNQSLNHLGRMTLSPTRCGLRIDPVRSEDAGEYKCEVFNQVSSKTSLPVSWP
ncbi:Carcinoembryonic antigen-related cell adhesion molecule 3 [Lemmus lemmus]